MVAFAQQRKRRSLEGIMAAATALFGERDYWSVSIEDIILAAGVSRVTFYRHFANKTALAIALFKNAAEVGLPRFISIREQNFQDRTTVVEWLTTVFAADRDSRPLLRLFIQANVDGAGFTQSAHVFIADIIAALGEVIPAFDVAPGDGIENRRWVEAWLLIYEILDQSHHAAMGAAAAADTLIIDIVADRFTAFLKSSVGR